MSDWVIADHSIGMNGEIWQEEGERQRDKETEGDRQKPRRVQKSYTEKATT